MKTVRKATIRSMCDTVEIVICINMFCILLYMIKIANSNQDRNLLWNCVAGAHLQCFNNQYAKSNLQE